MSSRRGEVRHPVLVKRPQRAARLEDGRAVLALRLGGDQVAEAFRLGEVDAAVFEGSPGEFSGFGEPCADGRCDRFEAGGDDGPTAMEVELGDVLAGDGRRSGKEDRDAAIDDGAGPSSVPRGLPETGGGGGLCAASRTHPSPNDRIGVVRRRRGLPR